MYASRFPSTSWSFSRSTGMVPKAAAISQASESNTTFSVSALTNLTFSTLCSFTKPAAVSRSTSRITVAAENADSCTDGRERE